MREVAVLGIGQTVIAEHWDRSLKELAGEACMSALADANISEVQALFVGNMLSGMLSKQENISALIADWLDFPGVEAIKVEAACGSGAAAFRNGLIAVSSGEVDIALVVGVEKMTESLPVETTESLATAADADYEATHGLSFVSINALVMQRYLYTYGWKHTDFAGFSINAHANALHNPYARLQSAITEKDYIQARMIASPINLLDASPIGDGAAAIILVPAEKLYRNAHPAIVISGSSAATETLAVHSRKDPLWLMASAKSAKKSYQQASISPEDIDLFELHDAFSIMSALSLEACGFADRGKAPRLAIEGEISTSGRIPITTLGGLKARGHPVGATGVYQIVEVVQQLRGNAGATQVENARIGMAQNIGGSGASVITHILQRKM